jgi:hypothetical protein
MAAPTDARTRFPVGLLLAAGLALPHPAAAQTVYPATPPPADTAAKPAGGNTVVRVDTVRIPAAAPAAAPADTVQGPDPSLVAACKPVKGEDVALVLVVIFLRRATEADIAAAVKTVGGQLAGEGPGGETLVAIPFSARPRTAADRMVRQRGVSEVSEAYCP